MIVKNKTTRRKYNIDNIIQRQFMINNILTSGVKVGEGGTQGDSVDSHPILLTVRLPYKL